MAEIKQLKPTVELDPEQAVLLSDLRELVERVLRGEAIGIFAVVVTAEQEHEPFISGGLWSEGELYMELHNLADMVRSEGLSIALGLDDEEG